MPQSDMRVIPAEIGGGFGGKTHVWAEPLATMLATKAGRPVKLVMTRDEVFRAPGPTTGLEDRRSRSAPARTARSAPEATACYLQAGALPGSPIGRDRLRFAPYYMPHVLSEGYEVLVNRPKTAAYRAPSAPMAPFAVECVSTSSPRSSKMDPVDFRLKNAAQEGTKAAHGPVYRPIG